MAQHAVENGRITRLSVSQVEKFDPQSSVWGCNRRWWFRYVARLQEPQTESQKLGEEVHRQIEHYLKTGQDVLGPVARSGIAIIPKPGPDLLVEAEIPENALTAGNIPFTGRIDVVNPRGLKTENGLLELIDWKTTSDVKYAKSPEQLRESVQMSGYAKWAMDTYRVHVVRLTHGVFGTRKLGARRIPCEINLETVTYNWRRVDGVVERMKQVARELDVGKVEANRKACRIGRFECPFLNRCPGGNPLASLLDRFSSPAPSQNATATPARGPDQPVVSDNKGGYMLLSPAQTPASIPTGVLPPDAPKSDPKLAADPVPGFSPAPQAVDNPRSSAEGALSSEVPAKRGPGRPRKMKIEDQSTTPDAELKARQEQCVVVIDRVTLRKGAKIGLPGYSSATVEVELSAAVKGNPTDAFKVLEVIADAELKRQAEPLKPAA